MTRPYALTRNGDYKAPAFQIESIDLAFDLSPLQTIVSSRMDIRLLSADTSVRLDCEELELLSIAVDGQVLAEGRYELDAFHLTLRGLPREFRLEIRNAIAPARNKSGSGLFLAGETLATQCEAEGFRRITFFPDRPDILTRFRVTLTADRQQYPTLLSNGEQVASGDFADGRHWVTWEDPFPKPCYIFALVAGRFALLSDSHVTPSGRRVAINIHAAPADIGRCGFAMAALKRSLEWDEAVFGLEYDLGTYNVVALADWVGAMENKGLNLHGIQGVAADMATSTDGDFVIIERILGHEQFHNWTGNRVTCRDWFQLSLKEGLTRLRDQMFIADKMGKGAWRIDNVQTLRRNQFAEDDGPAAHPIKPDSYAEIRNFYTPTVYDKGAEVVRMVLVLLGWEAFRRGFDLYIARHDGSAVTTEDFIRAMEDASGRDLSQFRRWYSQAGRPRVVAEGRYDAEARTYRLTLRQSCRTVEGLPAPQPFHIPILTGLIGADGTSLRFRHRGAAGEELLMEMTETEQDFLLEDVAVPPVPSLLRGFSAPVTLEAGLESGSLALLTAHDPDPFSRWDASQQLGVRLIREMSRGNPRAAVPDEFVAAFATTLADPGISDLLKSQIISLPDLPVLDEGLDRIDLDALMSARGSVRRQLAVRLRQSLLDIYHDRARHLSAEPDFAGISARALKNNCLDLLMALGDDFVRDMALTQVRSATNMTDQFAALSSLIHVDDAYREAALDHFARQWRDHPTVIDKWFQVQAMDRGPGGAARIVELSRNPGITADNVPRAIAFYGTFFRQNRVSFHDPDGIGYALLADQLLKMDAMGRAFSRYLMPQINQWRRHDLKRQKLMQAQLERILATNGISKGLRESVLLALAAA